jgi:GH35 family endo-1,4-beta-xylanase
MRPHYCKTRDRRRRRFAFERLESRSLLAAGPVHAAGLTATYFDNADLTGTTVSRIDPFVDFDFGEGSPAPGIGAETFSARWTGQVRPEYTEDYTVYAKSDNGVRLWVNNVLVINNWTSHLETENASPRLPFVAGRSYDVRLEYFDDTGRAAVKLLWSSASVPKAIIPTELLSPSTLPPDSGQILLETFANVTGDSISDLAAHATFPSSPTDSQYLTTFEAPNNRGENFGSRVRGYLIAPESGAYTFWIASDNQAELYLSNDTSAENKRKIASVPAVGTATPRDWDQFPGQRSAPIRLIAGQRYYVEVLHKDGAGNDHLAVGWELPGGVLERPIPASRLLPILPEVRLFTNSPATHESTNTPATFHVVRDDDFDRDLTVRYYLGGTATVGVDYSAPGGEIVIPRGQRSAQIVIAPLDDTTTEGRETVVVMLAPSAHYVLGPPSTMTATASITDGLPQATGTNLLPANPLTTVIFNGGQFAARQVVNVSGMPFAQALQVTTHTLPANVWDIQLRWNNTSVIQANDTLFATFWLRNADATKPEASVDIVFEMNGTPWTKSADHTVSIGTQWTRIDLPFRAVAGYAVNGAAFALRFGYLPQTVQIGGLSLVDYGGSVAVAGLPQTQLAYTGHEATADWRVAAESRIDQIRKATLTVKVTDALGNPLEGAKVDVAIKQHEFGFGSAIAANPVLNNSSLDGSRYRALVKSLFSRVVIENAVKWPNWESARQTGINLVNWLVGNGLEVRGHNLVWPNWQHLPSSVKATYDNMLATQGQAAASAWLRQRVTSHIADEASALAGKLIEWDVVNEPYTNHELMDILGNSAMIDWFRQAKQSDPSAVMFLNDYNILSALGADYAHQNGFYNAIQYLRDGGAPIEGIGMQGHFGSGLTGVPRMLEILDRFAAFGLPIAATEFDVNVADEQVQADFTRDFMTTLFSHPAVNGILTWGFWQNAHWRPQAAMFRSDWTIKPNGQAWVDLVHNLWNTETVGTTLSDGGYTTRGFRGDYDIEVSFAGKSKSVTATLAAGGTSLHVVLDDVLPESFQATAGDDALTLRASSDGTRLEVFDSNPPPAGSTPVFTWPMNADLPLSINTLGGDDSIYVELPAGSTGPAAGIRLDAGAGADNQLFIRGGNIRIDGVSTGGSLATTVATGAQLATNRLMQAALTLADNSRVTLLAGGDTSRVTSLSLGTGSTIDIGSGALVVDYSGDSPLAAIRESILSGRGGPGLGAGWNGSGITSGAAAQANQTEPESRSVGFAENAALPLGPYTTFRGQPVDDTALLIVYTRTGDANLDGIVNDNDVTIVGASYAPGVAGPHWALGDFDFNGFVDDDDVTLLGAFYEPAASVLAPPALVHNGAALLNSANAHFAILAETASSAELPAESQDLRGRGARRRLPVMDDFWTELKADFL